MALSNKWVGYVDRSYQQIKDSLTNQLVVNNPEVTDHSESNILIIILSMFAGVAEMLNYYIDNMAREAFIGTARRFSSMVKLVRLLDYRVQAASASSADVVFTFNAPTTGVGLIPIDTLVQTANNVQFLTYQNTSVPNGTSAISIGVRQVTKVIGSNIGTTNGLGNQAFPLGLNYVHGSLMIKIALIPWTLVNSLGLSTPTDKHFIVEIDVDGIAYVVFGDGVNGAIPPVAQSVIADLETTLAELGNVNPNTITTLATVPPLPGVSSITITNPNASTGGAGYETVERIRISAPLSIRTLDRAVTFQDYVDIAKLAPGVGKAAVLFDCGKTVQVYIVPIGGGIAQSPLLVSTDNYFEPRRMVTTFIDVLAAGQTRLYIEITAAAKFREDPAQVKVDIENALIEYGSYLKQTINKKVRLSDIISLVDNLPKVDFMTLVAAYSIPYAYPFNHLNQLSWTRKTLPGSVTRIKWTLQWTGVNYTLYKGNLFMGLINNNVLYSDGIIEFTPQTSGYTVGDTWEWFTYPYNMDINLDDYSIPFVQLSDLVVNVSAQIFQPIE